MSNLHLWTFHATTTEQPYILNLHMFLFILYHAVTAFQHCQQGAVCLGLRVNSILVCLLNTSYKCWLVLDFWNTSSTKYSWDLPWLHKMHPYKDLEMRWLLLLNLRILYRCLLRLDLLLWISRCLSMFKLSFLN